MKKKVLKIINHDNVVADNIHYPTTGQLAKYDWDTEFLIDEGMDAVDAFEEIKEKINCIIENELDTIKNYPEIIGLFDKEEKEEYLKNTQETICVIEKKLETFLSEAESVALQYEEMEDEDSE